ncbi:hypothetical protein B0H14DRAFT_3137705 [Mycena olivaceomarginata]|nr:hypothetical protein B0H14DRAFT_3137705 [Mycena olivaceomarginata]
MAAPQPTHQPERGEARTCAACSPKGEEEKVIGNGTSREILALRTQVNTYPLYVGDRRHWSDYTPWIRPSTGVLSIELTPPASWAAALVNLHSSEFERSFEVAFSPNFKVIDGGWSRADPKIQDNWDWITLEEGTSILENGWIRVNSACVAHEYQRRVSPDDVCSEGWLAEANHIFNSLDIRTNHQDYFLVYGIDFRLQMLGPIENLPLAISFFVLGPILKRMNQDVLRFLDPPGTGQWIRQVWHALARRRRGTVGSRISVPSKQSGHIPGTRKSTLGFRQFHEAKEFDLNSQDVAIELGYPLFQVSCTHDDLLAYLREIDTGKRLFRIGWNV